MGRVTKPSELLQIEHNLNRDFLNNKWFEILFRWLRRFDGYVYDYIGDTTYESLLVESLLKITSYPELNTDLALAKRLASEFEGLHWTAICYLPSNNNEWWACINESYNDYKDRLHGFELDHLILHEKRTTEDEVVSWLMNQLENL